MEVKGITFKSVYHMTYLKKLSAATLIALMMGGAGCSLKGIASKPAGLSSFFGKKMVLTTFNDKSVPSGEYIVFNEDGSYNARFCNGMGGSYSVKDEVFQSVNTISTLMACADERMSIEQAFLKNLTSGLAFSTTGSNTLSLEGTDGSEFDFIESGESATSSEKMQAYVKDGDFEITYPSFMTIEEGVDFVSNLPGSSVVKFAIPQTYFNPTDTNNFREAFMVISETSTKKIDKARFMAYSDLSGGKLPSVLKKFANLDFSFVTTDDAAAGNYFKTENYRTVYKDRFYEIAITVHTTNAQLYTPAREEFTGDAFEPFRQLLPSFKVLE